MKLFDPLQLSFFSGQGEAGARRTASLFSALFFICFDPPQKKKEKRVGARGGGVDNVRSVPSLPPV